MEDDYKLTLEEAKPMEEVYRQYVKEHLEDIYTPTQKDKGLIIEVKGPKSPWIGANPKTMEGIIPRLNEINLLLGDYEDFREVMKESGKCPSYRNKATDLIRRN